MAYKYRYTMEFSLKKVGTFEINLRKVKVPSNLWNTEENLISVNDGET